MISRETSLKITNIATTSPILEEVKAVILPNCKPLSKTHASFSIKYLTLIEKELMSLSRVSRRKIA